MVIGKDIVFYPAKNQTIAERNKHILFLLFGSKLSGNRLDIFSAIKSYQSRFANVRTTEIRHQNPRKNLAGKLPTKNSYLERDWDEAMVIEMST